jgi:levanase/fructan beta-fructosidase
MTRAVASAAAPATSDLYRPRLHFTPARNWINDPNGLVFHDGVYHLFYQHNPFGTDWGNMSWGHATSPDLLTWTEQPVAIPCDAEEAIFSGSAVVDERNTTGFGDGLTPPMVAIYTSAYSTTSARPGIQAQSLAYSLDNGQTWTKYAANPVLDRGSANFRDPKVFWYSGAAGAYWVMVAVEAEEQRVLLYKSANLIEWEFLSDFRAETPGAGLWECPDLFELPLDGDPSRTAWVLVLSSNPGGVAGGSGTRYFLGEFDGVRFVEAPGSMSWLDWGRDYYAAVSFNGLPHHRIMIGWMNNWDYAAATPTGAWRSAMSLPRELVLRTVAGRPRLVQTPVVPPSAAVAQTASAVLPRGEAHRLRVSAPMPSRGMFGVRFGMGDGDSATVAVDAGAREVRLDRRSSGLVEFHELFASVERAPLEDVNGELELDVYVDACSLEVFVQGGLATITDLVFPRGEQMEIEFFADPEVSLDEFEVARLG